MIAPGETVTDMRGGRHRVTRELAMGGQGVAFAAEEEATHQPVVVKVMHPHMATIAASLRLDALVRLNLPARSPALCGPTVRLEDRHGLGMVMPMASGQSLETVFATNPPALFEALAIGAALCRALVVLEKLGTAHGDIAASNVMTTLGPAEKYPRIFIIDCDNASVPGAPAAPLAGQQLYAAPEVLAGKSASLEGDRFALGILLHELLLQRHPFVGVIAGMNTGQHVAFMQTATWPEDPLVGATMPLATGVVPTSILPRRMHDLFRRALQANPIMRPDATTWGRALEEALTAVYECAGCKRRFVNDPSAFACPFTDCRAPAEPLVLDVGGRQVALAKLVTPVGRSDLGGDLRVSREHAVFVRKNFALGVECRSSNGMAIYASGRWRELRQGEVMEIGEGDRVRFAVGVEGVVRVPSR